SLATAVILGIGGVARAAAPDHPQGQGNGNGPAVTHAPAHQGENDQGPAADPTPGGALTGSVKVDDVDLDDLPANMPHLACQLRVSVQHPNDGPLELTFEAQPPTTRDSGSQVLFDTVVPAGADSSEVVDLTSALAGITAQPEQGFHVKLTVAPVGASDQPAKHKVFWIQACPAPAAAPQVSGSASPEQGAAAPTQVL